MATTRGRPLVPQNAVPLAMHSSSGGIYAIALLLNCKSFQDVSRTYGQGSLRRSDCCREQRRDKSAAKHSGRHPCPQDFLSAADSPPLDENILHFLNFQSHGLQRRCSSDSAMRVAPWNTRVLVSYWNGTVRIDKPVLTYISDAVLRS